MSERSTPASLGQNAPLASAAGECACWETQDWSVIAEPIARRLDRPTAALFIDYGYAGPAFGDTLQAVRQHAFEDPLAMPGEADISCHVDFSAFTATIRSAAEERADIDGPISQAEFLGRLGAVERASRLMAINPAKALQIEQSTARLLSPGGMGGHFLVAGLRSKHLPCLPGLERPSRA